MYKSDLNKIKNIINDLDLNSSLELICDYLKKKYSWL